MRSTMSKKLHLGALGVLLAVSAESVAQTLVQAPAGPVQGVVIDNVIAYKGLPYAQAPVGPLRWRAPVALSAWTQTRVADDFAAACPQPRQASPSIYSSELPEMSEDCLYLNIWTPAKAEKAPVMVWIHGGSLMKGAGNDGRFDGAALAAQGVIVVTINYRLGVLGYLAHPELSAENLEGISGNYGLLDQVQALKWVRDNIAAFGGDPSNVSIAGESAGGLSVLYLMASPQARGLFHKAVAQSAYMISTPELQRSSHGDVPAQESGRRLAQRLKLDIAGLRKMEAMALVRAAEAIRFMPSGTVDGKILPRQLVDTFNRGEQAPVPLLAGFNDGEIRSLPFLAPPAPATAQAYEATIRARYGDLADAFLRQHPSSAMTESVQTAVRDAMYGWTAEKLVRKQTELGQPAYFYYFDHAYRATNEAKLHAFHAAEIPYIFATFDRTPAAWPRPPLTLGEARFSEAMSQYWGSFIRTGQPRAEGQAHWLPYGQDRNYLAFEDVPRAGRHLAQGMFELNDEVVCRRFKEGGVPWNWNVGLRAPSAMPPGC